MMDSGSPILAGFFFILLVFLGAFFLLNVILVVIISNYSETKLQAKNKALEPVETKHGSNSSFMSSYKQKGELSPQGSHNYMNQDQPLTGRVKDFDATQVLPGEHGHHQSSNELIHKFDDNFGRMSLNRQTKNNSNMSQRLPPMNENQQVSLHDRSLTIRNNYIEGNYPNLTPNQRKSSFPVIDRPKNSTPIIDLEDVISHEGQSRPLKEEDMVFDNYAKQTLQRLEIIAEVRSPQNESSIMQSKLASQQQSANASMTKIMDGVKLNATGSINLANGYASAGFEETLRLDRLPQIGEETNNDTESTSRGFSCTSIVYKIQNFFLYLCMSKVFAILILLLITMNTIILALDMYPLDASTDIIYDQINTFLTWFFFLEMLIKIIGLGVQHYIRDSVNIFDALVVLLTVAENITDLIITSKGYTQYGAVSGFRAIRLFRFFKVARTMRSFQIMIEKISLSLKDIASFSILLFLFLFTFTLLGLELFSNYVKFDENGLVDPINGTSPRPNFDDFIQGFVTIFMVLIGDNWPQYMQKHMLASGTATCLFFVFLQIFGKYVLLNLFLAILLENFEEIENEHKELDQQQEEEEATTNKSVISLLKKWTIGMVKRSQVHVITSNPEDVEGGGIKLLLNGEQFQNDQNEGAQKTPSVNGNQMVAKLEKQKTNSNIGILLDAAIGNVTDQEQIKEKRLQKRRKTITTERTPIHQGDTSKAFQQFNPDESQRVTLLNTVKHARQDELSIDLRIVHQGSATIEVPGISSDIKLADMTRGQYDDINLGEFDGGLKGFSSPRANEQQEGRTLPIPKESSKQMLSARTLQRKPQNIMETVIQPHSSKNKKQEVIELTGRALIILGPNNRFRIFIMKMVLHKYFETFIISLIVFSTVLMAIDNPLNDPNGTLSTVLNNIDIAITIIFCLESIFKIIHNGLLFNGKQSYLRISWNIMDFVIVVFSVISIIFSNLNIQFIKVIRMLRVLRPLRMISRNEGLKIAVISLINAVPSIINALVIALLFYMLFAIFGTTYFKGRFYHCLTDNIEEIIDTDLINSKWDCLSYGGEWINQIVNFDNVLRSMAALFVLSSTEGWGEIMFQGVDATAIDYNPKQNNQIAWAFFFMVFMIVGSLFMLNLFVSIVVNTYYGEKEKLFRNDLLTKHQKVWLQIQTLCLQEEPEKLLKYSSHKVQRVCQSLAKDSSWFDYFILCCIISNTIIMAINWYGCPPSLLSALEYTNYFFTAVFTIEVIIKWIAFGLKGYFSQGWNIFDFLIVFISYATLFIGIASSTDIGPKQATIARAFRIGRIFRLITKARFLRIIFNTIIFTIPSLANVGALMMLLLFIFSILGVQIFATVKLQDNLNEHANFQNFGMALLTLIRLQTGEGWNDIMKDLARGKDVYFNCDDSTDYDSIQANGGKPNGCGSSFSYLFFVLFQLIVSIIFLNLFVAVILNGFTNSNEEEGFEIFKSNISKFKKIWQKYDPDATGFINVNDLSDLVLDLENGTDFITTSVSVDPKILRNFIANLQVPTYFKFAKYYFQDILTVLSKKYIAHQYVLDYLKSLELQDDKEQVTYEKKQKEKQFEEELTDIQRKATETEKIQLIEENLRHAVRYKNRMYGFVDKFEDETEQKIYDSSYIVWVPYIQMKLKPWLKRYKDRKMQAELERQQLNEELDNMEAMNRALMNGNSVGDLIIETGSQIVSNMNVRASTHRRNIEVLPGASAGQFGGTALQESARNFPSANSRSLNEEEMMANMVKNVRGQTTGEVGGTLFLADDGLESSMRQDAGGASGARVSNLQISSPSPQQQRQQSRSARRS